MTMLQNLPLALANLYEKNYQILSGRFGTILRGQRGQDTPYINFSAKKFAAIEIFCGPQSVQKWVSIARSSLNLLRPLSHEGL